jgi:SOS-response transcriptional repressor LexA
MSKYKKPERDPEARKRGEKALRVLLNWMHSKSLNQVELATKMGTDAQTITNWKRRGRLPADRFPTAVGLIGCTIDDLIAGKTAIAENSNPRYRVQLTRIPVMGMLQTDREGTWMEALKGSAAELSGHIEMQSADADAYAYMILGDDLRPRIKPGEFVVCSPSHQVEPGDEVLVKTKDGNYAVREFLYKRHSIYTLGCINEKQSRITIPEADVASIHYISAIAKQNLYHTE